MVILFLLAPRLQHESSSLGWGQSNYQNAIEETVQSSFEVKQLRDGRTAFWSEEKQMVVIHDPSSPDGGNAFRPETGKAYFDTLPR